MKIQDEYIEGDILICRKRFTLYKHVFNTSFKFIVTKLSPTHITLDGEGGIPIETIRSNSIYSYTRTCHSSQGKTIKQPITVFYWKYHRVTNEWLYTAISRCEDLNDVTLYDYEEPADDDDLRSGYFKKR